ncbi:hypothetical protein Palpr_2625 [Paludibacter propionicigenes WB4]|uniref:DUF5723 domain-containing protein n=1 Tax=Paludibacter propionicigenes (strain DSM 17365 / JCM 13257 / WB4) TaxID=694427 RepID=E4T7R3_PALPW|nr:hypothetical protein [Paludibacter propionicigenes]ADQ80757.1 hypothetical protein Palpr_2625 [Paludibacter propionicigenes WB4]
MKRTILTVATALLVSSTMFAQLRATDQTGINVFETPKTDTQFTGKKVEFGASIAMPYIALKNSNDVTNQDPTKNTEALFKNSPNFALSMANLYINSYLADGITLQVTMYLASKHHNETWVKGGYVQFDKIPFIKMDLLDNIMKFTSIKVGQMDVNYGDAHFRRSDGGNAIYNPFMENYIMDEFATEIGAEADVNYKGLIGVAGITNGNLNPSLAYIDTTQIATKYSNGHHNPSFLLKLGFDKQVNKKFRARLTGSVYTTAGSLSNTLFGGDRTGSNYSAIMYNAAPGTGTAFNGRFNPSLTDKLTTFMGNLFLKYNLSDELSVESFTTLESAKGRKPSEKLERKANQFATDLVLRFGKAENFFVGARYNTVSADVAAAAGAANSTTTLMAVPAYNVDINRLAISGGWYVTKNIMAKVEYANQKFKNVPNVNYILNGYEFHGLSAEAVISF